MLSLNVFEAGDDEMSDDRERREAAERARREAERQRQINEDRRHKDNANTTKKTTDYLRETTPGKPKKNG